LQRLDSVNDRLDSRLAIMIRLTGGTRVILYKFSA
jgi:hypothetical protein